MHVEVAGVDWAPGEEIGCKAEEGLEEGEEAVCVGNRGGEEEGAVIEEAVWMVEGLSAGKGVLTGRKNSVMAGIHMEEDCSKDDRGRFKLELGSGNVAVSSAELKMADIGSDDVELEVNDAVGFGAVDVRDLDTC